MMEVTVDHAPPGLGMAGARRDGTLDHDGREQSRPAARYQGYRAPVHAAGLELAVERKVLATPPFRSDCHDDASPVKRIPDQASVDISEPPARRGLVRSDRERADRDDVAIAVALDAIGERLIDRGLFVGRLQSQPGRPAAPTATAFQPLDASASWRATSSRASADDHALPAALKKPVTFSVVGTGTTKLSSTATIMQATPAIAPQTSSARRTASSSRVQAGRKKCAPPGPSAIALVFRAGA